MWKIVVEKGAKHHSYGRDSASSHRHFDMARGDAVNDSVSVNADTLEADVFEQSMQMRRGESCTELKD